MKLKVLYFASLREALGSAEELVEVPPGIASVAALRGFLAARGAGVPALAAGRNVRAAVNQQMVAGDAAIAEGDEIAFFPPVTGG
ncbi:MAG: molybdopterin converting factor subunit 1 [Rhodocyclaceae bacterium]|nr:molybdopterin converting factor subunit 1 [Rhodocyclaceae bacterium]MCP5231541.1 molybdopterin converting factor subunit 1 [Zoogloeaceae bacterium]MCB1911497.1 molybdopterin converting factor subunit 1 [Rhodocyclaceae bacterium]MCP5254752.1 molybdopterin converting factor subunit 1 [Zoogloeaceae bacterium]MCP5294384.1 molybdopterin converting factor subunit 1 [Zoogloeaceae bacterium]